MTLAELSKLLGDCKDISPRIEVAVDDGDYHRDAGLLIYFQKDGYRQEILYIEVGR